MAPHDLPVAHAQRAGGLYIVELAVAQKFGAHVVGQTHPAKQAQQHQQQRHAGRKDGTEDDEQIQLGHGAPDLDEALERQVGLAPKVTLNRPGQHAQQGARDRQRQRKQHTDAEAVNQLRQQVAPPVVGAQPVVARRGGRIGLFGKVVQRFGAVRVGRKHGPVATGRQAIADERVEVVSGGEEVATKGGFGVVTHHGVIGAALITHQQRLVVGQDLGHQTQQHQRAKQHQAPVTQPVALEALPGAAGGGYRRRRSGIHASKGFSTAMPQPSKSRTLRVTRVSA